MYAMVSIRLDICYDLGIVSRFKSNLRLDYWTAVKTILKYLRGMRNYMLVFSSMDVTTQPVPDYDENYPRKLTRISFLILSFHGKIIFLRFHNLRIYILNRAYMDIIRMLNSCIHLKLYMYIYKYILFIYIYINLYILTI